ncbi:MAG TPA: phosphonate utilization associated transcriptional regulator [Caldimonas sp.]|jgi:phosphonate utilization transcriptional regulator|nr:phosphonate utilization associated transcriptional regulator [Caldimonas sp.]HEX2540254.1 phosphonate utilization associated transcriptional regulator [Caldimonas sp.]
MGERLADIAMLQSHSLTMLVQRELERMVLTGELSAGKKLNEAEISTRLGVSRGPVRESFRALQEAGLVRLEKNRGVFVREVSVDEADDIYEIRATLDQMAGRKLAVSIRREQLAALRALVARMRAAAETGDVEGYHEANLAFHDALVEYAGNPKLLQIYRRLVNELSLFRRHTLAQPHRLPSSTLEHEEILSLIESGQAEAAGQKLHEHATASRGRVHALAAATARPSPADRDLRARRTG